MSTNTKKLMVSAFVLGSLIAGCGQGATTKPSAGDTFQQAQAYAQCMRANGVPNFPDPQRQGNGVSQEVNVPKGGDDAATNKALEACRDKMPQGKAEDGNGKVDSAKLAAWTKCMRAKLPKFPDPEVSGGTINVNLNGTGMKGDSAEFENARKACDSSGPGGSLRVTDGQ